MGTTNEKAVARSEKTQPKSVGVAGGGGITGGESEFTRSQQKRNYRANSEESSIFSAGATDDGGMLDHLIDEYVDQVEKKKEEIRRIENEVNKLETKVQEFKVLREQLKKDPEKLT